jgi:hypothetical protein
MNTVFSAVRPAATCLKLLGDLRMPVVTTLHTVLKDPAPEYRAVMGKLSELSDKLVVMSHKAFDFLKEIYACPKRKLSLSITAFRIRPLSIPASTKTSSVWKAKKCCSPSACFPPIRASKMYCRRFRRSSKTPRCGLYYPGGNPPAYS